jgi:hypothetical protein
MTGIRLYLRMFTPFNRIFRFSIASLGLLLSSAIAPQAQETVAIELVLALDASASMSAEEFDLQIGGIAEAFRDPLVQQAIERTAPRGVALGILQWGGPGESVLVLPFRKLETASDAIALANDVARITRQLHASTTSISTAMTHGLDALAGNDYAAQRLVIDISGDGRDDDHATLEAARDKVREQRATVNGLAIESEDQGLTHYYEQNVMTGANSFVVRAADFKDYVRAIREKLLEELRPLGS